MRTWHSQWIRLGRCLGQAGQDAHLIVWFSFYRCVSVWFVQLSKHRKCCSIFQWLKCKPYPIPLKHHGVAVPCSDRDVILAPYPAKSLNEERHWKAMLLSLQFCQNLLPFNDVSTIICDYFVTIIWYLWFGTLWVRWLSKRDFQPGCWKQLHVVAPVQGGVLGVPKMADGSWLPQCWPGFEMVCTMFSMLNRSRLGVCSTHQARQIRRCLMRQVWGLVHLHWRPDIRLIKNRFSQGEGAP